MPSVQELDQLRQLAIDADPANDDQFRKLLEQAKTVLLLDNGKIADALLVSRPTVARWLASLSSPHPAMRRPIFKWIWRLATEQINKLTADL